MAVLFVGNKTEPVHTVDSPEDALFEAMDAKEGGASFLLRSCVLVPFSSTERTVAF